MAHKFKMKFKLQGLELELEGSRDDIPLMTQAVGQQFAGLLMPAADIVEGEVVENGHPEPPKTTPPAKKKSSKPKRQKPASPSASNGTDQVEQAIKLNHDPEKWGMPNQKWVTSQKIIWLLYIVEQQAKIQSLTIGQIVATFNQHFYQARTLQPARSTRDLNALKVSSDALVGEHTNQKPSTWYLTTSGKSRAQELVAEATGKGKS